MNDQNAGHSPGFLWLPTAVVEHLAAGRLAPSDLSVLTVLCDRRDYKTNCVSIGQRELAKASSVADTRTASLALDRLKALGLIVTVRESRPASKGCVGMRAVWQVVYAAAPAPIVSDDLPVEPESAPEAPEPERRIQSGAALKAPLTAPEPVQRVSVSSIDEDAGAREKTGRHAVDPNQAIAGEMIRGLARGHEVSAAQRAALLILLAQHPREKVQAALDAANKALAMRPISYASEILTRESAAAAAQKTRSSIASGLPAGTVGRVNGVTQAEKQRAEAETAKLVAENRRLLAFVASLNPADRQRLHAAAMAKMSPEDRQFFEGRDSSKSTVLAAAMEKVHVSEQKPSSLLISRTD